MIYFILAYLSLFMFLIISLIAYSNNIRERRKLKGLQVLTIFFMAIFSFMGISVKDPFFTEVLCGFFNICLSPTYEWIAYFTLLTLLIWKFIYNPLYEDVDGLKKDMGDVKNNIIEVKTALNGVKDNTDRILNKCKFKF